MPEERAKKIIKEAEIRNNNKTELGYFENRYEYVSGFLIWIIEPSQKYHDSLDRLNPDKLWPKT